MPQFIKKKSPTSINVKSVWSYRTRRLFYSLNEIPWLSLTALGTLLGVTILFWYFRSIDFYPSDFSVLIGFGVGAAASAFGVLSLLAIGLFAPAILYRFYVSESDEKKVEAKRHFNELEMVGLQLGGVGLTFGFIAYPEFRDCGIRWGLYGSLAVAMLLVWFVTLAKILLTKGGSAAWYETISTAFGIATGGMVIALSVIPLMPVFRSAYLHADSILFTLWALAILANASAATSLRPLQIFALGGFVTVFLFILIPVSANQRNMFPQMTANFLGIREEAPLDLRVPAKTCQLMLTAVPDGMVSKDLACGLGDWGKARAQILSKVGDQWLVEFVAEKESDPAATSKLRATISRTDVQIVREVTEPSLFGKPRACKVAGPGQPASQD